jgi:DNA-binding response OmpR family regulator
MVPKVLIGSSSVSTGLLWNMRTLIRGTTLITEPNLVYVARRAEEVTPDIILLDIAPIDKKSLILVKSLREEQSVPILVLLSIKDANKVLDVYKAGADECIVKPIEPEILIAKMNAWMKRSASSYLEILDPIRVGKMTLRPMDRMVALDNGCLISLTRMETTLLYILMNRSGRNFLTNDLINQVWNGRQGVGVEALKNLVYRLRKKLESPPANLKCIITIPGVGYKFEVTDGR